MSYTEGMEINQKPFNSEGKYLYDQIFEYRDFCAENSESWIDKYGKASYYEILIRYAKEYGYVIFVMYLSDGIRAARLKGGFLAEKARESGVIVLKSRG